MGILSRMYRLCKADVHGVMDQLEDKALLLKQYLREMESSLKAKEARLARIKKQQRRIQTELKLRRDEATVIEKDLDLAIHKEKDDIARMLIRKRRALAGSCEQLAGQIENLKEEHGILSDTLCRQRLQYDHLKVKAAAFFQKAEAQKFDAADAPADDGYAWQAPTDEEIELELLQRKEAGAQRGAA